MRLLKLGIEIIAFAGISCLSAATPAGTITSAEDFELSGARVPVAGVPTWPIVAGDEIATFSSPAYVTMGDGSKIMLRPNSKVRIEQHGSKLRVRLVQGDLKYTLSNRAHTEVTNANYASISPNMPSATVAASARSAAVSDASLASGPVFVAPPVMAHGQPPCGPNSPGGLRGRDCAPGLQKGKPPVSNYRP